MQKPGLCRKLGGTGVRWRTRPEATTGSRGTSHGSPSDEIRAKPAPAKAGERRFSLAAEGFADDLGAQGVAMGGVEGLAVVELQVGRQGQHEEAVDRADGQAVLVVASVPLAAEAQRRSMAGVEAPMCSCMFRPRRRWLRRKRASCELIRWAFWSRAIAREILSSRASAWLVRSCRRAAFSYSTISGMISLSNSRDDGLFADAEGDLVGELVEVAGGFAALAEEAADRQAHVLGGVEELFDLAGQFQGRHVQHHRHADARAQVRRAGGQVAEPRAERVINLLLDQVVDAVDLLRAGRKLAARLEHLQAEVVFLADHGGEGFVLGDDGAARAFGLGEVAADEVPLDEQVAMEVGGLVDIDVENLVAEVQRHQHGLELFEDFGLLLVGAVAEEPVPGEVPGQANPRGNDDVGQRPGATEPFVDVVADIAQFHRNRLCEK